MSGSPLIALPPDPASPEGSFVAADGWWPGIDCNAARDALRIGEIVTQPRLIAALEGAMLTITGDLAWWQAALLAGTISTENPTGTAPATTLASVTAAQLAVLREPRDERAFGRFGWGQPSFAYHEFHRPRLLYTPAQTIQLTSKINGHPRLIMLYIRAVRCAAAAELLELYRDLGATRHSDIRAEQQTTTSADYQRMAIAATRDMLGQTRVSCELI